MQVRNKYFDLIKDAFDFHPLMRTALDQVCFPPTTEVLLSLGSYFTDVGMANAFM